jgi:transposase
MLRVEERFMIKDLREKGTSISEIARRTACDRKTVRQVLAEPLVPVRPPRTRRRHRLGPYVEYLKKRIEQGVVNASKLYDEIKAQGYQGCPGHVRDFVATLRPPRPGAATVRFETEPGEQAQVDWACFGTIQHHGRQHRLYAFLMTLGWSRAMYLEFTVSADMAWWLRCHLHAFHYLGGVPREVLHDNLKTAVLSRDEVGVVHWHPKYLDFASYYGFTPRACQPYRAQTKGKVEAGVHYVRINFWPGLNYTGLADLNQQAVSWLDTVANVRLHGTTGQVPFERLPLERLLPLLGKPDYDTALVSTRRSSADCFISYGGNFYSVPAAHHNRNLTVKETESGLLVVATAQGDEIACHRLAEGHGQRIVEPAHYQGLPAAAIRQRRAAAEQVLAVLPPHQIDAPVVETRSLAIYQELAEVLA